MLKKLVILSGLLLTSVTAHATIISHFTYERDSASNIVTGGGLEWLKWDVTKGMTINSALAKHAAQGWRLASNQEIAALFNTFQFGSNIFTGDENNGLFHQSPWSVSEASNHNMFLEIFGTTFASPPLCRAGEVDSCYASSDALNESNAIYGSDNDNDGGYKSASVRDDYTYLRGSALPPVKANAGAYLSPDNVTVNTSGPGYGVALVRTYNMEPSVVPTPGTTGLLALGLVALGYRRRQVLAR